jgi:hypothetical protein
MNTALDLIASHIARPLTHRVTTVYEGGATKSHDTHSEAQANLYATGERRKIGRSLKDRDTGATVRVIAMTVDAI